MRRRFPWLGMRRKTDPEPPLEPPIRLGNASTGEYFHEQTPRERRIRDEILRRADEKARRLGMDRREFLASAMGMATSLAVVNAASCGGDDGAAASGAGGAGGAGGGVGGGGGGTGGYAIPDAATEDADLACALLDASKEFIFDIQTHHIEKEGEWRQTNPTHGSSFANTWKVLNGCQLPDAIDCISGDAYIEKIFLESDTTVAVLSGYPGVLCTPEKPTGCGAGINNDEMARSRDRVNALASSQRVVQHCQVAPNDQLDLQLAMMERIVEEYGAGGFKAYPPWGPDGKGWFLDDEAVGIPFIEKARELGVKVICVHKGIVFPGWDAEHADPRDVGVVAKAYPDVHFVVYHSAIDLGGAGEGPYDAANPTGIDRLIKTVEDNALGQGSNVYAELGSVWAQVMNDPTRAQHVIGKLLKHLGEDNVLWGSECVWLGSPQPQIEAFRVFEISTELQEQHGYPALTPAIKAKIFGRSSAKVYGVDPEEQRCKIDEGALARLKRSLDGELGPRRWALQRIGGPRTWSEFRRYARVTRGRPI
jgi:hypothetical protein